MATEQPPQYGQFPITPWSLVGRAANATPDARRDSLGQLLQRYLPALRAHLVLRKGIKPQAADDLMQGFIADKVVASEILARADRERGKFRTFLCTALDHYVVSQSRRTRAKKRSPTGDGSAMADIDDVAEPADDDSPPAPGESGDAFDVAWARQVIESAVEIMRADCLAGGRRDVWELFDLRVLGPTLRGEEPPPYEQIVKQTGATSPLQLSNLLVTGKRMFLRTLRGVIAEYARDDDEVEEELRDLKSVLAHAMT